MALIKCIECGKEFSDRAAACPNCGCPTNITLDEIEKTKMSENRKIVGKYNIWGYNFIIDENDANYITLVKTIRELRGNIEDTMEEQYYQFKDIDGLVEGLPDFYSEILEMMVSTAVSMLTVNGVYDCDEDTFMKKYGYSLDINSLMEPIVSRYLEILNFESEAIQYREYVRQQRLHTWSGGGFGVKGALKGYFKAQMLNVGTNFLHSHSDNTVHSQNMAEVAKAKKQLYVDEHTKNITISSLMGIYDTCFNAVINELENAGKFSKTLFDEEKAIRITNNIFKTLNTQEYDLTVVKEQCKKAFQYDPACQDLIEIMFALGTVEENTDLKEYAEKYGFYEVYLEHEQIILKERYRNEIREIENLCSKSISSNNEFFCLLDKCRFLLDKGLKIEDIIKKAVSRRLEFSVSKADLCEVNKKMNVYARCNAFESEFIQFIIDSFDATEKNQKENAIKLCDDLIEKSRIIENSELFKILEQFYDIACQNPDIFVEEYVKTAIETRLNHYVGLNDINVLREKLEKNKSQYGYSDSLNEYVSSILESVEKKINKRYEENYIEPVNKNLEYRLEKQKIMSGYQPISVGGNPEYTVGIMARDGAVTSTRFREWGTGEEGNEKFQCKYWENMDSILVGQDGTYGLKGDGTVVAAGGYYPKRQVEDWKDIVSIANTHEFLAGLKQDGTVVITYCRDENLQREVQKWKNIVSIAGRARVLVGLRGDGTVVAVGNSDFGTTEACEVDDWKDIIYVSTNGLCTFGIKENGTVVVTPLHWKNSSFPYTANKVEDWENIISISSGEWHTVGLKSDGTVVAVGRNDFNQCNVNDWKDIVFIATGDNCTVGLKSDGTMVAVGDNSAGQCNLQRWRNLDVIPNFTSQDEWSNYKKQRSEKRIRICNIRKQRRADGVCQYCGKPFKGFILKKCSGCGIEKDY